MSIDVIRVNQAEQLARLPDEWGESLFPEIRERIAKLKQKIIVLDDDPTGTQTVHDVTVLTEWHVETLVQAFNDPSPAVFILTNSRSYSASVARAMNMEIARAIKEASAQTERPFTIISRSDSTLRGHFPLETKALTDALETKFDAELIIPAFMAGGRYTINDVHYVAEDGWLIPAGNTPFARDSAFGYQSSNLRDWVHEKTNGKVPSDKVVSIGLDDIRLGGADAVADKLRELTNHTYCIVNAITERDLEVVTAGLLRAEAEGKRFIYRTAASFAAIRAGIDLRPLLTADELNLPQEGGGLVVVGSYVPKTSNQLAHLLRHNAIVPIEVNVERLLDDNQRDMTIKQVVKQIETHLKQNDDVVVFTSRKLIKGDDASSSLSIGNRISASLVQIIRDIQVRPRYLIAKGGITSSDLATKALNVKKATVKGQILAGIPVWELGDEARYPDLVYVVFPGNVGGDDAITQVVQSFTNANI